jgi:glycerol-3-phosphate acyltransferase PlsY
MINIILILISYVLGSIPTGIIISRKFASIDPREKGSGNIGATNVYRTAGKISGIITLFADVLKGLTPVLIAKSLIESSILIAVVGFFAFIGHLYPFTLRFKGGKGVATSLGIFIGLTPLSILPAIMVFITLIITFRIVSIGSLMSSILMPIFIWIFRYPEEYIMLSIIMALFIIYRHKENIERLLKGAESKI